MIKSSRFINQFHVFLLIVLFTFSSCGTTSKAQATKKYGTHIVKQGETLRSIAKLYNTNAKILKGLNPNVKPKKLKPNTTLVVPKAAKKVIKKPKTGEIQHTVIKGNTLFNISKQYDITVEELKKRNNLTNNSLELGQVLFIPQKEQTIITSENKSVTIYIVQKGDTKWNIAKRYNITVEQLEEMNPFLKNNNLKLNSQVWVPDPNAVNNQADSIEDFTYYECKIGDDLLKVAVLFGITEETIKTLNPESTEEIKPGVMLKVPNKQNEQFIRHFVTPKETIYSITHLYDITQEELYEHNPAIKDKVLKEGLTLYIKPTIESVKIQKERFDYPTYLNKNINVSYLMPIFEKKNIDLTKNTKESQLRKIVTDFYMGSQMALEKLKTKGLIVNHHVYDTKNNTNTINNLINDPFITESEVIFGPFFFENAEFVANRLSKQIVVSPMYSKNQKFNNDTNLVKAGINPDKQYEKLIEFIVNNYNNQNLVIISDNSSANNSKSSVLEQKLIEKSISFKKILPSANKKNVKAIYLDKSQLLKAINTNVPSWIILLSNHKIINSDVVNTSGVKSLTQEIRLFTIDEFTTYDDINISFLPTLKWTFPTLQYINFDEPKNNKFRKQYKTKYKSEPSIYAYSGYDLTFDILTRWGSDNFQKTLINNYSMGLSRKFDYEKLDRDYENVGIFLIQMNQSYNFNLVEEDK